jgi:hypothetical protein
MDALDIEAQKYIVDQRQLARRKLNKELGQAIKFVHEFDKENKD